jgi:hypothetical protein
MLYKGFGYHVEDCLNGGIERISQRDITPGHDWMMEHSLAAARVEQAPFEERRCHWCGAFHPSVPEEVRVAVLLGET